MPPEPPAQLASATVARRGLWAWLAAGAPSTATLFRSARAGLFALVPVLAVELVTRPRVTRYCTFGIDSDADLARFTVAKYAHEALPAWLAAHPDVPCPSIEQLNVYTNDGDTRDPWGTTYWRACLSDRRGGAAIVVWSAGPDGLYGTLDDIRSAP